MFLLISPLTESSDEDEASGDEGLPEEDSDVSMTDVCSTWEELRHSNAGLLELV